MAFPSNLIFTTLGSDSFQRANESPLNQGGKWESVAFGFIPFKIVSDQCVPTASSGPTGSQDSYVGARCVGNQWGQFEIETLTAGSGVPDGFASLALGLYNTGSDGSGLATLGIQAMSAGVTLGSNGYEITLGDSLGTIATLTNQTVNIGDVFTVFNVGSTLYAYQNSTLLTSGPFSFGTIKPSNNPFVQVFGSSGDSGAAAFINFACGTVSTLPTGGFSPNWYEGQRNAGLAVYISPGGFGGVSYNGQLCFVPPNATSYLYLLSGGVVQTGPSLPAGAYGIAIVVSGQIVTTGISQPGRGNYTTNDGIVSITDIRNQN